jgi:hypothetical protein
MRLLTEERNVTNCLYPVYYLPGLSHRLLSIGHMLNNGFELKGSSSLLEISAKTASTTWLLLQFRPSSPGQNLYWLSARLTSKHAMLALSSVFTADYNIMHRCFAHPNKDVLRHASGNTKNLPSNMSFPSTDPVC